MSPPLPSQQTRGVFLFACLCFLPLIYSYWFVCDDAFISFRYAKHFALGEGLRYNLGTQVPVEGYSNLLWVILCAVFERLHLSVEFFAPLLSSTCALLLLYRLCTHLVFVLKAPPLLSLFGVLSFALFPPAGLWATGGLATAPFALLVFLCYEALFTWSSLRYATFFGVLLVLLRAEGVVVALGLGILSLAFRPLPVRRQNVFFLSSIVVATLLLTAWRWSYYGEFLPNTVLVKGEVSLLRLERGWKYVAVFCLTFLSSLLALVLSLYYLLRPSDKLFLPACCFLAFVAYAILSGGDFMPMGRFLAPAFAFQAILLTVT
ncbi:MAG: hypothetical protein KDC47_10895, partial [Flavobacteriaceae bacterium]|nr:hypothetical protein [Flavobacteriaceae bacterium]